MRSRPEIESTLAKVKAAYDSLQVKRADITNTVESLEKLSVKHQKLYVGTGHAATLRALNETTKDFNEKVQFFWEQYAEHQTRIEDQARHQEQLNEARKSNAVNSWLVILTAVSILINVLQGCKNRELNQEINFLKMNPPNQPEFQGPESPELRYPVQKK